MHWKVIAQSKETGEEKFLYLEAKNYSIESIKEIIEEAHSDLTIVDVVPAQKNESI